MINKKLAEIFSTFADIHELRGAPNDKFRTRAYSQASLTLQNLPKDITEYIDIEKQEFLEQIQGFGAAIKQKIIEYILTGEIHEFEEIKRSIPKGLLKMLELKNVGPKKVKKFYEQLGIENLDQLKNAIQNGSLASLEGMGNKSANKILESIENLEKYSARTPLGLIYFNLKEIESYMKNCPYVKKAQIAGSARRMQETIGDIDLLVTGNSDNHQKIIEYFKNLPHLDKIEAEGETKVSGRLSNGTQIDLRVVVKDEFGAALQYFSGNKEHNVKLRTLAKNKGYKINEYGIYLLNNEQKVGGKEEKEIYNILDLEFIPVELRQGANEIELAAKNKIPKLIELNDIKGDLHCHSTYSDGNNSIEEMALEAIKLGYEYIAITDHSSGLKVAGGMDQEQLIFKKREIDKLNQKLPIKILYGTEVDILTNGELDYNNKILSEFDFVVASIHSKLESDITKRLISAMKNPHVNLIGHPTTRLINKREPSTIDFNEFFKVAKETNTHIEINAQPLRLDLPDKYVKEAKENFGVKFCINTDAHNIDGLHLMELGIGVAKRGWLTKNDVINTFSYKDFQNIIQKNK